MNRPEINVFDGGRNFCSRVTPIAVGALWNGKLEMRWLITDELVESEK